MHAESGDPKRDVCVGQTARAIHRSLSGRLGGPGALYEACLYGARKIASRAGGGKKRIRITVLYGYGGGHELPAKLDLAISLRVWRRRVKENVLESEHHPVALRILLSGDVVLGRGRNGHNERRCKQKIQSSEGWSRHLHIKRGWSAGWSELREKTRRDGEAPERPRDIRQNPKKERKKKIETASAAGYFAFLLSSEVRRIGFSCHYVEAPCSFVACVLDRKPKGFQVVDAFVEECIALPNEAGLKPTLQPMRGHA
ncbi:hypothetical protein DFH08DRAFT_799439 [Mycena albidolilacea]|uniref:Uncharacterized protein n=1 Tax=Mycena albidolilacea TaxID=1033008 RepID=A0AAD7AMS2_9AGAR|nr:hypothetical protein DFH08DRAFT_799439 [Mycena albidolilacea]